MIFFLALTLVYFIGYSQGKRDGKAEERKNSERMMDLYLGTVQKKENEFKRRKWRNPN